MSKVTKWLKSSYIIIILAFFYVPLFFAAVFSFNADPKKGDMSFSGFEKFSTAGWESLFEGDMLTAITNSFLIAIPVSLVVIAISLMTVFGLWRQRNKSYKAFVDGTSNIPLINPDIITAVSLSLTFGLLFGSLQFGQSGYMRVFIAHIVMIVPFGITIMYPRSEKFNKTLFEASKDLGYGPVRTWFKTYLTWMMPVIIGSFVISLVLSLDDFIVTRLMYAGPTIGKQLYSSPVRAWSLAIGTLMLFATLIGTAVYIIFKTRKGKK